MPRPNHSIRRFEAVLERDTIGLGWTIARVPFVPSEAWPKMVRLRVRGTVNDFAFRTSLFPYPDETGAFFVLVNRAMQVNGQVHEGGLAQFDLEPDLEPRPAELPEQLDALLDEAEGLRDFYASFSESMRREMGKWINGVQAEDARLRRAQQLAERLLLAMEAETELPPLIEQAFRSRPRARVGWAKLTQHQRRSEIMAVYYYQSPESRQKRLDKLCTLAESKA